MDRSRPLWELYVIEGLSDDDFAVLLKIHHATIDGASGAQLLNMLLDVSPFAVTPQVTVETVKGERVPSQAEMFNRSIVNLARRPEKAIRLQLLALRRFGEITRSKGIATMARTARRSMTAGRSSGSNGADESDRAPRLPSQAAPATPFNRSITPHRRFAFRSVPLSDIKALKSHLDATVNDVVMGICAGALRRYLELKGALPTDPLVTMIPVSIRTGDEPDQWTNRVSGLVSPLPTHLSDPLERVATVHDAMDAAKQQFDLLPADVMVELSGFAPPALATRAIRMAASMRIADRMNPPVNLVISNVPGSRVPLYLGAARLKHYYPVSTVGDGMGLNITVTSYLDTLDFGLVACRELVPDLWDLADLCVAELDVLFEAAGIERPSMSAAARTAGGAEPAEAADESKTKAKARA
jgi:WS/DGAT/MGAT family acyltransferase